MTPSPITPGDSLAAVVAELRALQSPNPMCSTLMRHAELRDIASRIERLDAEMRKELKIATLKASGSLANNLCPDHRDKQKGKPCLACEIEQLRAKLAACESKLRHYEWVD